MTEPRAASPAVARAAAVIPLVAGLLALAATVVLGGGSGDLLEAIVTPPPIIRAALVGASVVLGLWLLRRALVRLDAAVGRGVEADVRGTLRGIRLVFLALAAFAAAGGWLLGHPLPLVIALVVAAVDVIETSFLLLLAGPGRDASGSR